MENRSTNYEFLDRCFARLRGRRQDATVEDGLVYATMVLHRDLEPGAREGVFNYYEALLADNHQELADRVGISRVTLWRRLKDIT